MEFGWAYAHLQNEAFNYIKNGRFDTSEDNECGSRKSAKTWSIEKFILLISNGRLTASYVFRKMNKDLEETIASFLDRCEMFEIPFKWEATKKLCTFQNGSFVKFKGLKTQNDKRAKITGLAAAPLTHGVVEWYEEAFEFTNQDIAYASQAVRGGNGTRLTIRSCNPWLITNWYIEYLQQNQTFEKSILGNVGNQFKRIRETIVDKRNNMTIQVVKVFNYTNWRVNSHLNTDDIIAIEQTRKMSPSLSNPSYYGVPGAMSGLIFYELMYKVNDIDFMPVEFSGGIDYGVAGSNTTYGLWGRDGSGQKIGKFGEWYHDNEKEGFMEPVDMARQIINFIVARTREWPLLLRGHRVFVDYAATGFLSILKSFAHEQGLTWLSFEASYKPEVIESINFWYNCLSFGVIAISKNNCPKTIEEYSTMAWDVKENTDEVKPIKKWDHTWDSDKYAVYGASWNTQISIITNNNLLGGKALWRY